MPAEESRAVWVMSRMVGSGLRWPVVCVRDALVLVLASIYNQFRRCVDWYT